MLKEIGRLFWNVNIIRWEFPVKREFIVIEKKIWSQLKESYIVIGNSKKWEI